MGLNEQQESDSFYKAVSTHLAILAVGPWDEYKDDLSPHFKMNPDLALSMVAPTTTAIKANQRSQTSAAVNVGITGRPDSTSGNNTVNTPATVSPSIAHLDPIMQHSAALSLLQEVRVLNKYLRHVPQEQDSRPFLIRLQLSILPTKRSQPYDVYTDISFLSDELGIIKATTKLFVEDNNDIYASSLSSVGSCMTVG